MRVRPAVVMLAGLLLLSSACQLSSKATLKMKGYSFTPSDLCRAVREDKREEVKLFLKAGMAPDAGGALCTATAEGNLDVLMILAEAGANLEGPCERGTPLLIATREGFSEIGDYLASRGAKVEVADEVGTTALMHAASRCDMTLVESLLEKKADATKKNAKGWTAWTFAHERGQGDMEALFLAAGAEAYLDPDREQFVRLARELQPVYAGSTIGEIEKKPKGFEKDLAEFRRLARLVCCQMGGDKAAVESYLSQRGASHMAIQLKVRLWGGDCGPCGE